MADFVLLQCKLDQKGVLDKIATTLQERSVFECRYDALEGKQTSTNLSMYGCAARLEPYGCAASNADDSGYKPGISTLWLVAFVAWCAQHVASQYDITNITPSVLSPSVCLVTHFCHRPNFSPHCQCGPKISRLMGQCHGGGIGNKNRRHGSVS